jgi:hypothetical protein
MQCEEDAHCSGVREVRPCAADCVSTWTAMCHLSKEADGSGNGSSSGAVSLDEFQLISYCMEDKVPFQSNGENDYVCMRTSQVVTVTTRCASARSRTHLHPPPHPPPSSLPPSQLVLEHPSCASQWAEHSSRPLKFTVVIMMLVLLGSFAFGLMLDFIAVKRW